MKIPSGMLALLSKPKEAPNAQVTAKPAQNPVAISTTPVISQNGATATVPGPREDQQDSTTPGTNSPAVAETPQPEQSGTDKFRASLDQLDSLLTKDFDAISLALSRDIVKRVMIELRTNPEYNGIVQDDDVRNIFVFLRRAVERAKESGSEKVEKKVKKAKKAGAVVINMPDSLDALGSFNTAGIDALLGLGKQKK